MLNSIYNKTIMDLAPFIIIILQQDNSIGFLYFLKIRKIIMEN